jgi:hypothetical protein
MDDYMAGISAVVERMFVVLSITEFQTDVEPLKKKDSDEVVLRQKLVMKWLSLVITFQKKMLVKQSRVVSLEGLPIVCLTTSSFLSSFL